MDNDKQQSRVYQFDPNKKRLKSLKYVSPEKKHMMNERKQAKKDRKNFMIGVALLILAVVALTFFKLGF